jgi:Domain of unknown function (DUF4249)
MKYITLIFIPFFMAACQKESTSPTFKDELVVEGYLREGQNVSLKLSRQTPFATNTRQSDEDIDNLNITIECENRKYTLSPLGKGSYSSNALVVASGKTYSISFSYNNKLVAGSTTVPSHPTDVKQSATQIGIPSLSSFNPGSGSFPSFPDPVKVSWSNPDGSYYLVVTENIEANPESINTNNNGDAPARTFRDEPVQGSSTEIRAMQFQYFGRHRLIVYHLNPEYAALYKDNGSSSQNLASAQTNLSNAKGVFTATSSDTLYLNVRKR